MTKPAIDPVSMTPPPAPATPQVVPGPAVAVGGEAVRVAPPRGVVRAPPSTSAIRVGEGATAVIGEAPRPQISVTNASATNTIGSTGLFPTQQQAQPVVPPAPHFAKPAATPTTPAAPPTVVTPSASAPPPPAPPSFAKPARAEDRGMVRQEQRHAVEDKPRPQQRSEARSRAQQEARQDGNHESRREQGGGKVAQDARAAVKPAKE
jgi:hypothetical protein